MRACVCACVLCGNVGSACSPRATRINALQTKCSPFTLFCCLQRSTQPPPPSTSPLSGHCWARRRRQSRGTGYAAAGKRRNKAECDAKYTSGLRQCRALPLSPSCLFCLMLRAINILNSELRPQIVHAHHPPTFLIFRSNTGAKKEKRSGNLSSDANLARTLTRLSHTSGS